jgi:hypothetical protein
MQKPFSFMVFMAVAICCLIHADSADARGMPAVNLNLIPTAETLGDGGYSFSAGMFAYDVIRSESMNVDVGGFFEETHDVRIESDIWLVPSRITYGISDRFDLTFGGTYSAGDTDKVIVDYYETDDDDKKRVYSQTVLEGLMGFKYRIQEPSGNLPALAVAGEAQMGYTVDNELVDETLNDSFPFVAMQIQMSASYDFEFLAVHGGLGMYLSSESIQASERFDLPIQAGLEIPFDGFAAVVDLTLFGAFSGVGMENIVSGGLRYDISPRAMLNASVSTTPGFLVRLTIGGGKPAAAPPSAPTLF